MVYGCAVVANFHQCLELFKLVYVLLANIGKYVKWPFLPLLQIINGFICVGVVMVLHNLK